MNRFEVANQVGVIGFLGNAFLFLLKIIVGVISGSQALIADAINSASDSFASIMTWIGNKISSVPNDDSHNYGHGKAEYIFSMLISISMMLVSVKLLIDGIVAIVNKDKLIFSWVAVLTCVITLLTKLGLFCFTKKMYNRHENLLVKATMIDHRNDCLITLFTTIAILFSGIGIYWFDKVVGISIAIWIFVVGVKIFKESYFVLMDGSIDNESKNVILAIIKENSDIKRIGTLYSVPIGHQYLVAITIFVNKNLTIAKSHKIADELEKNIMKKIDKIKEVIVHIEPYKDKGKN